MGLESRDLLALYGAVLSTLLAVAGGIRVAITWLNKKKERRKLWLHLHELTIHNRSDKAIMHMLPVSVSNLGRESVIVQQIIARGPGHTTYSGVFREPAAAYGIQERLLPKRLEPGQSEEFCFFYHALFRNQIDEIVVIDADGNEFKIPDDELAQARENSLVRLKGVQ